MPRVGLRDILFLSMVVFLLSLRDIDNHVSKDKTQLMVKEAKIPSKYRFSVPERGLVKAVKQIIRKGDSRKVCLLHEEKHLLHNYVLVFSNR